jgi:hypothetical protein
MDTNTLTRTRYFPIGNHTPFLPRVRSLFGQPYLLLRSRPCIRKAVSPMERKV